MSKGTLFSRHFLRCRIEQLSPCLPYGLMRTPRTVAIVATGQRNQIAVKQKVTHKLMAWNDLATQLAECQLGEIVEVTGSNSEFEGEYVTRIYKLMRLRQEQA